MKKATARSAPDEGQEYVITSAPESHASDLSRRRRNYLISMGIRLACMFLVFIVPAGWPQILVVIGAVFIPYFAVVGANSGAEMIKTTPMAEYSHRALGGSSGPGAEPASEDSPVDSSSTAGAASSAGEDILIIDHEPDEDLSDDDAAGSGPVPHAGGPAT